MATAAFTSMVSARIGVATVGNPKPTAPFTKAATSTPRAPTSAVT